MKTARFAVLLIACLGPARAWAQDAQTQDPQTKDTLFDAVQIGGSFGFGLQGGGSANPTFMQDIRFEVEVPVVAGFGVTASGVLAIAYVDGYSLLGGGLAGTYDLMLGEQDALRFSAGADFGTNIIDGSVASPGIAVTWVQEMKMGPTWAAMLHVGFRGSLGLGAYGPAPLMGRLFLGFAL